MRKYLLLTVVLSANYFSGFTQTSSQTRTAAFLNNIYNFRQFYGNLNYPSARAEDVAADDDNYGCSKNLKAVTDSTTPSRSNSLSILALQGFGFTIPNGATIENIALRIRRSKNGRPSIGDHTLSVMQRYDCNAGVCRYGVHWTYQDEYPGKIYPDIETEYVFSQSGSGNNGGPNHNQAYQWTPTMVNNEFFGVRIDNYPPIGQGAAAVCYDLVEVTVEYSQPPTIAGRSSVATEVKPLKEPIIYPNPFRTKTNIQFTASESGRAIVELYNIAGTKIRTLFSANVVQGEVYGTSFGDALLANGVYVYTIRNGKQKHTGKIIKLE